MDFTAAADDDNCVNKVTDKFSPLAFVGIPSLHLILADSTLARARVELIHSLPTGWVLLLPKLFYSLKRSIIIPNAALPTTFTTRNLDTHSSLAQPPFQ